MSDDRKPKIEIVSNVPPEVKAAALKAKAEQAARDATTTEPPLSEQDQQRIEVARVHTVLVQKLDRLLRDTNTAECPACHHDQRFVHPPLQFAGEQPERVVRPLVETPTVMMHSCRRCGLVRWHALNAIVQAPAEGEPTRAVAVTGPTPVPESPDDS